MVLSMTLLVVPAPCQSFHDLTTPLPIAKGDTLVVGFLGGWERWDDANRGVRKLALAIRDKRIAGLHVETIGNRQRGLALELVRKALDGDSDGNLDAGEVRAARVILYGQSFGGAAAVKLARELEALGVPVQLTIQVDSVGIDDNVIPSNVGAAANFYQAHRFTVRGEQHIRAADPARTRIIENTRFDYSQRDASHPPSDWFRRRLGGAHAWMDADPAVWARVETLILQSMQYRSAIQ
jgi:hypothetical protein